MFFPLSVSRSMKPKDCREYVLELLKYRGDADTYKVAILLPVDSVMRSVGTS